MKKILLLGEYSSGKTTFANMLLGYPVLPEKIISTDLPVVKIAKGDSSKITNADILGKDVGLDSWEETPRDWKNLQTLNISIKNHPLLEKEVVIYDTPGINTTNFHHMEHLEKFLNTNPKDYKLALFFIPDKISKTSIDFLLKWKSKLKNLIIVINIKDIKSKEELKQIEKNIKLTTINTLPSIPTHLLSIGDLYEQFFEKYENSDDWRNVDDWEEKQANFFKLLEENIENLEGEDLFELVWAIAEKEEEGVNRDYTEISDDELLQLIQYDDPEAMYERARRFFNKEMYEEAVAMLREAVKFGNSDAEELLGVCYEYGWGVNEDINTAHEYYKKSANAGNSNGLLSLGLFYLNYEGEEGLDKAFELIKRSADLGNEEAKLELGKLFLEEKYLDEDKAFKLINEAYQEGVEGAATWLGRLYHYGIGVEKNTDKAIELYKIGVKENDPIAYYSLYLFHIDESINFSLSEPLEYIKIAAEAGIPEAQFFSQQN